MTRPGVCVTSFRLQQADTQHERAWTSERGLAITIPRLVQIDHFSFFWEPSEGDDEINSTLRCMQPV
ncbi:hypothetical protein COCON_G00228020 [Conger conger]|uniref:Uncharacterized protein n=1 Tax=Conger conger TaxID=82655 RepID=A0A9Q1HMT2_CONCO|nr:hypothetical protein COCON_G00228020 [Conger conger]